MKNLPYDRSARIADAIYEIISTSVLNEVSDPRLKGVLITNVRMTRDLGTVRVNFHLSKATEEMKRAAMKGLLSSRGLFKRSIASQISLRFMPEIEFHYDESVDAEERIEELLKAANRKP